MNTSTTIRIDQTLYEQVYLEAVGPHDNFYRDLKRS